MNERTDLTRWNRAGLTRFRYVDGNAIDYLETLRQSLVKHFADPQTGLADWLSPAEEIPANEIEQDDENLVERQERFSRQQARTTEMYHQDRRDWAWELSRTFARSCHMLTEYADAYANEGYLGTATQWDHVRRLVEMLDYHPAPPASASTRLVLLAKANKSGIVQKGFQVKNSPPKGGDKVIFETLGDLFVDAALNEMRPKGWDDLGDLGSAPPPESGPRSFSVIANGPVIDIKDVGIVRAGKLDGLAGSEGFRIRDLDVLDPDDSGVSIGANDLWEFKAKANQIFDFAPEGDWSLFETELLPDIAATGTDELADTSGNSLAEAESLKLELEIIEICLDRGVYDGARLGDLFAPAIAGEQPDALLSAWRAPRKPKVEAEDVAMVMDTRRYRAEAVTVDRIEPPEDDIHLLPSPAQYSWYAWKRSDAALHVSPRWKRRCWLNGRDVIRTVEPHGISADAYICWKDSAGDWAYADVTEVDKRNLRLRTDSPPPPEGAEIHIAVPFDGDQLAADFEEIVLIKEGEDDLQPDVGPAEPVFPADPLTSIEDIFTMKEPLPEYTSGGGLLPPAALPEIGSFLFPSPMLPMDLVKAAVEMLLSLGVMQIPSTEEFVFKGLPLSLPEGSGLTDLDKAANSLFTLLDGLRSDDGITEYVDWHVTDPEAALRGFLEEIVDRAGIKSVLFKVINEDMEVEGVGPLLAVPEDPPAKAVVQESVPVYMFDGKSKIESGEWVVGRFAVEDETWLAAGKVNAIEEFIDQDDAETFSLSFRNLPGRVELREVYAEFRGPLEPDESGVNVTPVDPNEIELEELPESLKKGKEVLLTDGDEAVAAKIAGIDGNTIKISPPAPGFRKGELVILGNVVQAGHGESKPERIFGSGNAARSNQDFVLDIEDLSFTADATKSSGVAAAIEVDVAGRVWEQVSTLKDSVQDDIHYAIRMTEDGYVKLLFGDGQYGRRLPTGKNNLRVRYRVGSGTVGNLPAHALEKAVNPHPLIDEVKQPLPAAGGGDMESLASLRENAPATLLALERAVSLSDFSHLAAAQSSVWQAKAHSLIHHGGRMERVKVVIVPAGGVESDDLERDIESFLQQHALPGVHVIVDHFIPKRFDLAITVRFKSAEFLGDEVERSVASALTEHFALQHRRLGEHLFRSEVYKIVESVQGVENSVCVLNDIADLQVIEADNEDTVVYLDTDAETTPSTLTVTLEEYRP